MQSVSHWGLFPTPTPAYEPPTGFTEGFHHAVTINQAHERYRKIMFGLRASLPDATEEDIKSIGWAVEDALKTPKVKEAIERLEIERDIFTSIKDGVDICT